LPLMNQTSNWNWTGVCNIERSEEPTRVRPTTNRPPLLDNFAANSSWLLPKPLQRERPSESDLVGKHLYKPIAVLTYIVYALKGVAGRWAELYGWQFSAA
jgi:hypothetical protein